MPKLFETYDFKKELVSTHTTANSARSEWEEDIRVLSIRAVGDGEEVWLYSMPEINDFISEQEIESYWSSQIDRPKADAVNPSHYQGYISTELETLQWLEAMQYLPNFRDPKCFKAAVELQARKYLDRNGGKDAELQELQKGLWYFKFLVAYIKNGDKPIRVKDIDTILNG